MAESSTCAQYRVSSDLAPLSDDESISSSASTTSAGSEEQTVGMEGSTQVTMTESKDYSLRQAVSLTDNDHDHDNEKKVVHNDFAIPSTLSTGRDSKPLHLLDLPMDILKDIIKEV